MYPFIALSLFAVAINIVVWTPIAFKRKNASLLRPFVPELYTALLLANVMNVAFTGLRFSSNTIYLCVLIVLFGLSYPAGLLYDARKQVKTYRVFNSSGMEREIGEWVLAWNARLSGSGFVTFVGGVRPMLQLHYVDRQRGMELVSELSAMIRKKGKTSSLVQSVSVVNVLLLALIACLAFR